MQKQEKIFPNEVIFDGEYFNAHQDWDVPIPGFFIIAAKRKILSISEFSDEELKEFMNILRGVRKGMKDVLGIDYIYLFQNEKTDHELFHIWILPHHQWMEKFGNSSRSIKPIVTYAKENMANEKVIGEVKEAVKKMRDFMEHQRI